MNSKFSKGSLFPKSLVDCASFGVSTGFISQRITILEGRVHMHTLLPHLVVKALFEHCGMKFRQSYKKKSSRTEAQNFPLPPSVLAVKSFPGLKLAKNCAFMSA